MIRDFRRRYFQRLALLLISAPLIGSVFGHPWVALMLMLAAILAVQLYRLNLLINWLKKGKKAVPPDAGGLWGMVFDHLYREQRLHHKEVKHLRNVISRVQSSTEALRDGVVMLDQQGALQWWNQAAGKLLRFQKQDEGQLLVNLLREPAFLKFYNELNLGEAIRLENPAYPGRSVDISMTIYGKGERLLLIRDTTRMKQLEQMRQDFVANASHELKTPLTVLKGYLESILDFNEDLPAPLQRALNTMNAQTKRMDNLVSDLLVLTRLDAEVQQSVRQRVDVATLLESIADDASELSNERGHEISLQVNSPMDLQGDPGELRSAISNLVFNAIHYSPDKSRIELSWTDSPEGGFIAVRDNGIGIDPRHIPRLTERFYRVDPGRSSEKGGTGLGLAIVKHILQHHQAQLDIASVPGKGSVFTCHFPVERLLPSSSAANRRDQTA